MNIFLLNLLIFFIFITNSINALDRKYCKCQIQTTKRLVGGRFSFSTDYPWMISISDKSQHPEKLRRKIPKEIKLNAHIAGGLILNEKWILTTASAVLHNSRYLVGYANRHDLVEIFDAGRDEINRKIIHPQFNKTLANDIALLELKNPIQFSKKVLPACLNDNLDEDYDSPIVITGYGVTSKILYDPSTGETIKGNPSKYLKEINYKDVSNKSTSKKCKIDDGIICIDSMKDNESFCDGDQGSPVHKTKQGITEVIGLVMGSDYAIKQNEKYLLCNGYGYATRVAYYIDFIRKYVNDALC